MCPDNQYFNVEPDITDPKKYDFQKKIYLPIGCSECKTCSLGSYVAEGQNCSTVADRVCTPCPNALPAFGFWTGNYDKEDKMCDYGCLPGFERDKISEKCVCASGFFRTDSSLPCTNCTQCTDQQFDKVVCQSGFIGKDSVCEDCYSYKPPNSRYTGYDTLTGGCTWSCYDGYYRPGSLPECRRCTTCEGDYYMVSDCTGVEDRICRPCPLGAPEYASYNQLDLVRGSVFDKLTYRCTWSCYETFKRMLGPIPDEDKCDCDTMMTMKINTILSVNLVQPVCKKCAVCDANALVPQSQYAITLTNSLPCTSTIDTTCRNCTVCSADQYVGTACTSIRDTQCTQCRQCDFTKEWMYINCSSSSNHLNIAGYDTACRPVLVIPVYVCQMLRTSYLLLLLFIIITVHEMTILLSCSYCCDASVVTFDDHDICIVLSWNKDL
jgi:hypothetical protein